MLFSSIGFTGIFVLLPILIPTLDPLAQAVEANKEGPERIYYQNGQLQEESHWRSGRLNGSYNSFLENSQSKDTGLYRRGWKTGIWKYRQIDGTISSIDYGENSFQVYGHYYGVNGPERISHFISLDMTARWPALLVDRLILETGLIVGGVSGNHNEYLATIAPEFRVLWCFGSWVKMGPTMGYEKWPRLASTPSFGGRISLILQATQGASIHHSFRPFTELVLSLKVLNQDYQVLMIGSDLWGF